MSEKLGPHLGKDMLREQWLRHFCTEEECRELMQWLWSEGLSRPRGFEDRLEHAAHLRELGNDWYKRSDYRRALHCMLGAVHTLDVKPAEQLSFSGEQQQQTAQAMLPVISNLAMILLRRGDFYNAERAATTGLRCARKLPAGETVAMRAKLHYRRALARGEPGPSRDLDGAREDLVKAVQLEPSNREVRTCLDNCKELLRGRCPEALAGSAESDAPNSDVRGERQPGGADGDAEGHGPQDPARSPTTGPSPTALRLAECVGRCLGRWLRRWRRARSCLCRALAVCHWPASRPRWMAIIVLGPLLGLGVAWSSAHSKSVESGQVAAAAVPA